YSLHAGRHNLVLLQLMPEFIDALLSDARAMMSQAAASFRTSVVADQRLGELAASVRRELIEEPLGAQTMLDALVHEMAVHLLRSHLTVQRAPQIELSRAGLVDRRIRLPVELMYDHF